MRLPKIDISYYNNKPLSVCLISVFVASPGPRAASARRRYAQTRDGRKTRAHIKTRLEIRETLGLALIYESLCHLCPIVAYEFV
jgi:hypothetical protein